MRKNTVKKVRKKEGCAVLPPILIVEDTPSLSAVWARALRREGYAVRVAASARNGLLQAKGCGLILLDILLPDGNGLDLCGRFKRISDAEILFVSSLTEDEQVAAGLDGGGDDYIRKPFSLTELLSRVRASFRRQGFFASADLASDRKNLSFVRRGETVLLTRQEHVLLQCFLSAKNEILSRNTLQKEVWGSAGEERDFRAVDTAVARLRKKLGLRPDGGAYIETVRGKGYRFSEEDGRCIKNSP